MAQIQPDAEDHQSDAGLLLAAGLVFVVLVTLFVIAAVHQGGL